jgi:hypothetical protein
MTSAWSPGSRYVTRGRPLRSSPCASSCASVGVHLSTAFASGTRIDKHLSVLDDALIGRLDLYAHARPGSALTLWEDEGELVAAAVPLDDGTRFLAGRYAGADAEPGWYDASGTSLRTPIEARPVPLSIVTSAFGERMHPLSGLRTLHRGVDYGAPTGTPVRAVAAGVVSSFTISDGAGIALEVAHADTYLSRYFHMETVAAGVTEGARVAAGEVIGYVGSTGLATGPHLHFELLHDGVLLDAAGLLPASSTRLPARALAAHQTKLRELVIAQLEKPTVRPDWKPPATLRAPPPPPSAWGALPEESRLSPEQERAREEAELRAEAQADARAHAELEALTRAEAEREARDLAEALAREAEILRAERERDAKGMAEAMAGEGAGRAD